MMIVLLRENALAIHEGSQQLSSLRAGERDLGTNTRMSCPISSRLNSVPGGDPVVRRP